MLQVYLINTLIFTAILLLIVLIVGAVQLVLILIDARRATKEVMAKVQVVTSAIDLASLFFGGLSGAHKRYEKSTLLALAAGLKKGLQVLFKRKGGE